MTEKKTTKTSKFKRVKYQNGSLDFRPMFDAYFKIF